MAELSGIWGLLLAAAIAGGILGVLNYTASLIRNQRMVHDLKLEVVRLHSSYLKQLKEQKEREESVGRPSQSSGTSSHH